MIENSYDFLFKNNKEYLTLNNEIDRLKGCSDKLEARFRVSMTIVVISAVLSLTSIIGFFVGKAEMSSTVHEIFGVVSFVAVPVFLSSLFVAIYSGAKSDFIFREELSPLRDQKYEMFIEKVRKDLKEQYGAMFFNGEIHPSYSRYEIKFDNGKHYKAKVFYINEKMMVELLSEKKYMEPTGVSTDEKPKTDFDVIEELNNI